jgi:hypothetical protein
MMSNVAGEVCICPSDLTNLVATVDCSPNPQTWPMGWLGLDLALGESCRTLDVNCTKPVSIEETTWGTIKSLYR